MNKTSMSLTAAALMACAGAASAATITQTAMFGPTATNWTHTFSFTPFNPALGTLTKVSDMITETIAGTIVVKNNGTSSATYMTGLTNTATKHLPGLTPAVINASALVSTGKLAPGASSPSLPIDGSSSTTATTMSGLSAYEGSTLTAVGTDVGAVVVSGGNGNGVATFSDTGKVVDKLVFTYTPATTKTPEPATLTILGAALAGLGVFGRRRRRG